LVINGQKRLMFPFVVIDSHDGGRWITTPGISDYTFVPTCTRNVRATISNEYEFITR